VPTLTRWYIKTSLAWFVAALTLGVLSYLLPATIPSAALQPVYLHMLVVGWITQLIFGVVYWMFPKASLERPRGSSTLAAGTFIFLNLGLAARAVGEPMATLGPDATGRSLLLVSAGLQWLAGLGFVANTWPRVTPGPHSTVRLPSRPDGGLATPTE
jgi:hypothetical protein